MTRAEVLAAKSLLRRVAPYPSTRWHDPVRYADRRTSACDARTALNIALGYPLELIDSLGLHPADARKAAS